MKYFSVALKNLDRQKKRSFLLGGAIAFGVMIVILIGALASGLLDNFLNNQASVFSGHVLVKPLVKNMRDNTVSHMHSDKELLTVVTESFDDIRILAKRTQSFGTFHYGSNSMQQIILGVDLSMEEDIKKLLIFEEGGIENMTDPAGILIAHNIADSLQVHVGETILVKLRTIDQVNNVGEFTVAGIISEDMGTMSALSAYVNLSYLNELIRIAPDEYTELNIYFMEGSGTEAKARLLYNNMIEAGLQLVDRPEDAGERLEIRSSLDKEEWEGVLFDISSIEENFAFAFVVSGFIDVAGLIVTLILLLIILVGIFNTLRITIYERTREIGTMRALGMQRGAVRNLFLIETLLLALAAVIIGLVGAAFLTWILTSIPLDPGHTFFSIFLKNGHITLKLEFVRMMGAVIIVLIIALLAAFFPSRKAARIDPAKAIHNIN